jgi:hypothetical protein
MMTQPTGGRVRASALVLCGIVVLATAACNAASAGSAGTRHPAAAVLPQIPSQVSCRSSAAWLTLSSLIVLPLGSGGSASSQVVNTCYTGDGTRTVAVPQVEQAAVRAGHAACLVLYQNGYVRHVCIAGGKSRSLVLPSVTRVELSTETSSAPT